MLKLAAMEPSKWISVFFALSCATVTSAVTRPSWDIPFQLNRNYGLTAMNSDLNFPMSISPPPGGQLYSVPAQTFFSDKQLPSDSLYMQLNFQPNFSLSEFYFLTIRDPDGVLRFSLSMYKRQIYGVQLRYNLLDSGEGERVIDFPFPQSPTYWRLGVLIQEDSVKFFTNCPRLQSAPFHEEQGIRLLGRPLFRDGASAFLLNSGLPSNPAYFQGVLTEFTFHSGPDALSAPCKTTEFREESGESLYNFDPDFGNVIAASATNSSPHVSCSYFPIIDLTDGTVRLFSPFENSIIVDSRVRDGAAYFPNGTVLRLCENFVGFDEDVNIAVIVDLSSGNVRLQNTSNAMDLVHSNVTIGFPLVYKNPRLRAFLVWRNVSVQVDTLNGTWMVKLPESNRFERSVKLKDGHIFMPSGQIVSIPLKIRNPKYMLTLEPNWGTISVYTKATGRIYGRVSYLSKATITHVTQTTDMVTITGPPAKGVDATALAQTRASPNDDNKCLYLPAVDLTTGTVYLYDFKQRRVLMNTVVQNGSVYFNNGSMSQICDTFTSFNDLRASITLVNLTNGEVTLLDAGDEKHIQKSDVLAGLQLKHKKTRPVVAWRNIIVRIDTRNGDWMVEDPDNGKLTKAKEVVNGKIMLPDGNSLPIQLKIHSSDFALILEPSAGQIGVYKKSNGELYARLMYTTLKREAIKNPNRASSYKTFVPLQHNKQKVGPIYGEDEQTTEKRNTGQSINNQTDGNKVTKTNEDEIITHKKHETSQGSEKQQNRLSTKKPKFTNTTTRAKNDPNKSATNKEQHILNTENKSTISTAKPKSQTIPYQTKHKQEHIHQKNLPKMSEDKYIFAWTEGVATESVAEVTPQSEEVEAVEVSVTGVATDASTEATPQPEALVDITSEGATTSAASVSSAWTEGVATESVAEVTPQSGDAFAVGLDGLPVSIALSKVTTSAADSYPGSPYSPLVPFAASDNNISSSYGFSSPVPLSSCPPFVGMFCELLSRSMGSLIDQTKDQSAQEILQPDCQCLERLLTPELLNKLRNGELDRPKPDDKVYDELFKTPAFLRVVREVINDYFDRPGVVERYKPNCLCPTNNDCQCPEPVTTPKPPYNISSSSRHILGALKDMSNGAIIMNNESVLAKVAYSLAPGSMVYLSAEDSFFLKTDEKKNIWRKIDMNTQSESVRIPAPQTTTTTTSIPALAENLVGKSLMLIAHNEPLNGELRFGAKITGGHSSAIFACQRAARRHNISHVFYPLMSTDMFNMDYVVPPMYRYDMPIVNRNGRMLFNDFMHLIKGDQPAMAPIYTFAGKELDSDPTVPCAWIGAKPIYLNGDYAYAARSKCRNWQTHSPMESGLAVHIPMNANATGFLDQSNLYEESCAKRCSVLCIQISPN